MSNAVPEDWHKGVLEDLAEINPALKQRADLRDDTPVSFIKMEDVSNRASIKNVRIVPYNQVSKGFTRFQNHDVLLAKITPCFENGKGGYAAHLQGGVGFGSTEFHVLRAKNSSDSRFLYQYTNYPAFRMEGETNMTGSAGQRRVPTEFLRSCPVLYPPLPEQQKIATILSSVDDVIETTRAQIDKLKDLKTGMMQELLTKGVGVDGVPHTEFKGSPVGRIPSSWDYVLLESVATVQTGVAKNAKAEGDMIEVPYLRVANVQDGYLNLSEIKSIRIDRSRLKRFSLKDEDVLVNEGGDFDKLGRGAIWENQISPCVHQNHKPCICCPNGKIMLLAKVFQLPFRKPAWKKVLPELCQTNNQLGKFEF
jgi:type I restriction enzyme S subunit